MVKVVATFSLGSSQAVRVRLANKSTGAACNCKHVKGKYLPGAPMGSVQYVKYCTTQTQIAQWLLQLAKYNYGREECLLPAGSVKVGQELLDLPH